MKLQAIEDEETPKNKYYCYTVFADAHPTQGTLFLLSHVISDNEQNAESVPHSFEER